MHGRRGAAGRALVVRQGIGNAARGSKFLDTGNVNGAFLVLAFWGWSSKLNRA